MSLPAERYDRRTHYTYEDYLAWGEDVRAELINGRVFMMASPLTLHQRIAGRLYIKIGSFLEGKTCEAFIAPFGVRLFPQEDMMDDTVVEPDMVVVCDPAKIDRRGCNGPPDLVIEILSPSNPHMDKILKFNAYLQAGVREYWIVDPEEKAIAVHILDHDRYFTHAYAANDPDTPPDQIAPDILPVSVLPGLTIDLNVLFR